MADLIAALWPASYKGVPFWVERDDERGGRRLIVHQFPKRDSPFLEDNGAAATEFDVTAYLAGDESAAASSALTSALISQGAGQLVLPTHGSRRVRNAQFSRARSKDRIGYIAYTITFWVEGAPSALASVNYMAQLAFDAVDALAGAAKTLIGR